MRAQLSLAWVIGPPLSFMLALNYGFTLMFSIAAGIFVLSALVVWFILPSVQRAEPEVDASAVVQGSLFADKDVLLLFIASMLMWTCNTMYIIDMPLYITANLGLPERLAGLLMGTAAGLKSLLCCWRVTRSGVLVSAKLCCLRCWRVCCFIPDWCYSFKTALMLLQIFNAIFIGIVAGIGMLYFQDLMPGRAGAATTLFTNSISTGVILAGGSARGIDRNLGP